MENKALISLLINKIYLIYEWILMWNRNITAHTMNDIRSVYSIYDEVKHPPSGFLPLRHLTCASWTNDLYCTAVRSSSRMSTERFDGYLHWWHQAATTSQQRKYAISASWALVHSAVDEKSWWGNVGPSWRIAFEVLLVEILPFINITHFQQ